MWLLGNQIATNFAHAMTAQLSWHVQNFVVINSLEFKIEQKLQWKNISEMCDCCVLGSVSGHMGDRAIETQTFWHQLLIWPTPYYSTTDSQLCIQLTDYRKFALIFHGGKAYVLHALCKSYHMGHCVSWRWVSVRTLSAFVENWELSWCHLCCHWWKQRLSLWEP